jgi:uncharacterized membrane protein
MSVQRGAALPAAALLGALPFPVMLVVQLVNMVVSAFFVAGMYRFSLKVARGEPYSFNDLFSGVPFLLWVLVANFITAIVVGIGFVLLIVPGIILALGLSMTVPLIIDRNIGPIEALTGSWKLTEGSKGTLFIFGLLAVAMSVAGLCACGVGLLLVLPIIYVAHVYIYLKLSGQPVAPVGRVV